jgi:hypothetical protein
MSENDWGWQEKLCHGDQATETENAKTTQVYGFKSFFYFSNQTTAESNSPTDSL